MGYLRAKTGMIRDGALTPPQFAVTTAAKDARLIVEAGEANGVRLDVAAAGAGTPGARRPRRARRRGPWRRRTSPVRGEAVRLSAPGVPGVRRAT
ncbi:hypothetical protein LV779_26670 [Streptomyces thinghirensis]|nr:hypothetical protein [Streptomyces thinghirensis]